MNGHRHVILITLADTLHAPHMCTCGPAANESTDVWAHLRHEGRSSSQRYCVVLIGDGLQQHLLQPLLVCLVRQGRHGWLLPVQQQGLGSRMLHCLDEHLLACQHL